VKVWIIPLILLIYYLACMVLAHILDKRRSDE